MELHIIRHGKTFNNQAGRFLGWSDSPLLAEEIQKLESTKMDSSIYDSIYSSDLGRCRETCSALRLSNVVFDARLRERNLGIFENQTRIDCETKMKSEFKTFKEYSEHYTMPDGESRFDQFKRIKDWLLGVSSLNKVLAVTHGGSLDFFYRLAMDIPLHGGDRIFDGENSAISIFSINWPQVTLIKFNTKLYN